MVTMRERVRVVKVDKDNPEKPPEIVEQETTTKISLDDAALLGFVPGQGFSNPLSEVLNVGNVGDGPAPPVEGAKVGDE
jgi:hypothetical protein